MRRQGGKFIRQLEEALAEQLLQAYSGNQFLLLAS
jgi:hypothetical protein